VCGSRQRSIRAGEGGNDVSDTVKCPSCGEELGDLWDYSYSWNRECAFTNCSNCGKPVVIIRHVSVDYTIRLNEEA
jgi:hydrogenase maturation factor HypF (carbamoyltransferase family)